MAKKGEYSGMGVAVKSRRRALAFGGGVGERSILWRESVKVHGAIRFKYRVSW
jgi:hypothetical protein